MPSHSTFYVSGRFLHDRFGTRIFLRGINLPLLDHWDFPDSDYLDAVAQSSANAIRIQWYVNYPQPPADQPQRQPYSLASLDSFLHRCAAAEMIPILMLADLTCASETSQLNALLVAWWTDPDVLAVLNKHTKYLIINIGNEVGYYHWAGDSSGILASYVSDYSQAIASIRQAGLNVPLMIDATDCGSSLDIFTLVGKQLIDADPLNNILLSAHAYWAGYDGFGAIEACIKAGLPIVLGEMSNLQDGDTSDTYISLDQNDNNPWPLAANGFTYQALLAAAIHHGIGWLAWSWGPDDCPDRMLSTDGTFASLTPWGRDFLTNPTYGLVKRSQRHVLLPS